MVEDKVNLRTTYLQSGKVEVTGEYDRKMLELWIKHAIRENGGAFLKWEIVELEE